MREERLRSVIKGISWRLVATLTTIALVFIFTRSVDILLKLGLLEMISKLIFYYFHERIWNKIGWGKG